MTDLIESIVGKLEQLLKSLREILRGYSPGPGTLRLEEFRLTLAKIDSLLNEAIYRDPLPLAPSKPSPLSPSRLSTEDDVYLRRILFDVREFTSQLLQTDPRLLDEYLSSPSGVFLSDSIRTRLSKLEEGMNHALLLRTIESEGNATTKIWKSPAARFPSDKHLVVAHTIDGDINAMARETSAKTTRGLVRVWFATDRYPSMQSGSKMAVGRVARFDDGRGARTLSYGHAEVSIPASHRHGRVERPSLWKLELSEDDTKHVVIKSCQVDELSAWKHSAEQRFDDVGNRSALVFIHGYNVGFDAALHRTAQIGFDIDFDGLLTCFSWGSENKVRRYLADLDNADQSAPRLAEFLRTLRLELKVSSVHIIAHSMGNRVLLGALKELSTSDASRLHEIVMAAPDVDCEAFQQLFPNIKKKAKRYTLYGSDKDKALLFSKKVRAGYPRIGDGGENVFVIPGIETLDASDVTTEIFDASHGYAFGNRAVLSDLHYVVRTSTPVDKRSGLTEVEKQTLRYWKFCV